MPRHRQPHTPAVSLNPADSLTLQRYEALERRPINGSSLGFVAAIALTEASIGLIEAFNALAEASIALTESSIAPTVSPIAPAGQRMVATGEVRRRWTEPVDSDDPSCCPPR